MAENVKVAVRMRPYNGREKAAKSTCCIKMKDSQTIIFDPETKKEKVFTFDYSYNSFVDSSDPGFCSQKTVWEDIGVGVLDNAFKGYNVSLFAYGQTGAGKSYSMMGYPATPINPGSGIIPIASQKIFERVDTNEDPDLTIKIEASMLEIYMEKVKDLFNVKAGNLKVRNNPKTGPYVEDLTKQPIREFDEVEQLMEMGTKARTVASTNMNATSSRAHTIFQLYLTQTKVNKETMKATDTVACINLIDLAGSERQSGTGASGQTLKEGCAINQSLSALGNVISALAKNSDPALKKKVLVPFRSSVLTQLLKTSLGGNAKTIMIAAISPASINYPETLSTLRYADRAKQIKNKAVVNEDPNQKLIRQLKEEIMKLKEMMTGGTMPAPGDGAVAAAGAVDPGAMEEMRKKIEEEKEEEIRKFKEQLAENEKLLQERSKTWEEKLAEGGDRMGEMNEQAKERKQMQERAKLDPHFSNLHEDESLNEKIFHFIGEKDGEVRVGKANCEPPAQIVISGLNVQKEHATLKYDENGIVQLTPIGNAKCLINGEPVPAGETVPLYHNYRVLFGNHHIFRFVHPGQEKLGRAMMKNKDILENPNKEEAEVVSESKQEDQDESKTADENDVESKENESESKENEEDEEKESKNNDDDDEEKKPDDEDFSDDFEGDDENKESESKDNDESSLTLTDDEKALIEGKEFEEWMPGVLHVPTFEEAMAEISALEMAAFKKQQEEEDRKRQEEQNEMESQLEKMRQKIEAERKIAEEEKEKEREKLQAEMEQMLKEQESKMSGKSEEEVARLQEEQEAMKKKAEEALEEKEKAMREKEETLNKQLDEERKKAEELMRQREKNRIQKTLVMEQLQKAIPLTNEANEMAKALTRPLVFELIVLADHLKEEAEVSFNVSSTDGKRPSEVWAYDVFEDRLYEIREMYNNFIESGEDPDSIKDMTGSDDPFRPSSKTQLIGRGLIMLTSISHMISIDDTVPVLNYKGSHQGVLRAKIMPHLQPDAPEDALDAEEEFDEYDNIEALIGKTIHLTVTICGCKGIPEAQSKNVHVKWQYFLEELDSTIPCEQDTINPSWEHVVTYDQLVTKEWIQYVRNGDLALEVYGSVDESRLIDGDEAVNIVEKKFEEKVEAAAQKRLKDAEDARMSLQDKNEELMGMISEMETKIREQKRDAKEELEEAVKSNEDTVTELKQEYEKKIKAKQKEVTDLIQEQAVNGDEQQRQALDRLTKKHDDQLKEIEDKLKDSTDQLKAKQLLLATREEDLQIMRRNLEKELDDTRKELERELKATKETLSKDSKKLSKAEEELEKAKKEKAKVEKDFSDLKAKVEKEISDRKAKGEKSKACAIM